MIKRKINMIPKSKKSTKPYWEQLLNEWYGLDENGNIK